MICIWRSFYFLLQSLLKLTPPHRPPKLNNFKIFLLGLLLDLILLCSIMWFTCCLGMTDMGAKSPFAPYSHTEPTACSLHVSWQSQLYSTRTLHASEQEADFESEYRKVQRDVTWHYRGDVQGQKEHSSGISESKRICFPLHAWRLHLTPNICQVPRSQSEVL